MKETIAVSEVLKLFTSEDVNIFLKNVTGVSLEENNLTRERVLKNYQFVGNEITNASTIDLLSDSGKGIIERLTNSIDAVIEKQKIKFNSKKNLIDIMKDAFPKFSKYRENIINSKRSKGNSLKALDAEDQVKIVMNDGSKGSLPTIDILDKGIGIQGENYKNTVLSLHGENKINTDKNYLIGSFGQGGSTSLSFCEATLILSKYNDCISFTVVKRTQLRDLKSHAYCYLVDKNRMPYSLNIDSFKDLLPDYLSDFINSESGTLIRMIDTQIDRKYRGQDITKATGLIDYLNTELYDVKLPIKVIDNRPRFLKNKSHQNRNAMGSMMKLKTTSHVLQDYSGKHEVKVGNCYIDVHYYIILPQDESDWGNEKKCLQKYREFNNHEKPIFYTVNGQYITGESMTKLNNAGLNFLKYRIMVNIDLDKLGKDKYRFFTTDRSRIKKVDNTSKLLDNVVSKLTNDEKLIEINSIIADRSINSDLDDELVNDLKNEIRDEYKDFLKSEGFKRKKRVPSNRLEKEEMDLTHQINDLEIVTNRKKFYRNEQINIKLMTKAYKDVNMDAKIDAFVDGFFYSDIESNIKNGCIIYDFTSLESGNHSVQFQLAHRSNIISNTYEFQIIDEYKEIARFKPIATGDIDFDLKLVKDANLICDVIKESDGKKIRVFICLNHEKLEDIFRNLKSSIIDELKLKTIKPLALFALLYKNYSVIESEDDKNEIMLAYIQAHLKAINIS